MGVVYLLSRGGMGDGDVRLSPLLGAFLGFLNPGLAPVGLFFGFFLGAVASVPLLIAKRVDRRTALPFGPVPGCGAYIAIFFGQHYIDLVLAR